MITSNPPRAAPTPIPALAPVERPLCDSPVTSDDDGALVAVTWGEDFGSSVVWGVVVGEVKSESRHRMDTP